MARKQKKLTEEQVQELRKVIWRKRNISTEIVPLEEEDMRREATCSNSRSSHCPGGKAEFARAAKLLCSSCAQRTGKARARIEARAHQTLRDLVKEVNEGHTTFNAALNAWK